MPLPHNNQPLKNNNGFAALAIIIAFSVLALALFSQLTDQFMTSRKEDHFARLNEARSYVLSYLETQFADDAAIKNSRLSENINLYNCITKSPPQCQKGAKYDMLIYPSSPPMTVMGSIWPSDKTPDGVQIITPIAGGTNTGKVFYTITGSLCPNPNQQQVDLKCPLQAIVQFTPFCGGTVLEPNIDQNIDCSTGPVTSIEIRYGVGIYFNGQFSYRDDISDRGDTRVVRFKVKSLLF